MAEALAIERGEGKLFCRDILRVDVRREEGVCEVSLRRGGGGAVDVEHCCGGRGRLWAWDKLGFWRWIGLKVTERNAVGRNSAVVAW